MNTITEHMSTDHKQCDDIFAALETDVTEGRWEAAERAMREFAGAMRAHFAMEEEVLFPAFEAATGNSMGPTVVMRSEHVQMREILKELDDALAQRAPADFAGIADTLNIMLQQHNMKEEGILYPMTDRVLANTREEVLDAMSKLAPCAEINP